MKHIFHAAILAAALWLPDAAPPAGAQRCAWGGTSAVPPPAVTHLRAISEELRSPGRLAVDAAGTLYATDPAAGTVVVRHASGRLRAVREGFQTPLAIAVGPFGDLYVGEQDTGSVSVFDRDWNLLDRLGQGTEEFLIPNDAAVDPTDGAVFVSDGGAHRVKVYDAAGSPLYDFGGRGTAAGELDFPAAVHVSAAGEVFVGDQNNARVQVFDRQGNFLRCFGSTSTAFRRRIARVQGLAGDALGRIYLADAFQGHVKVFDAEGIELATIGELGEGPGQLRTPVGLAVDPFNRLFVASMNNGRLEVYGLDEFSDPTSLIADVEVRPARLPRSSRGKIMVVLEIAGTPLDLVVAPSITANGVSADPRPVRIGDRDRDGVPDLSVRLGRLDVLATLPDGPATIAVAGQLVDGTLFEGAAPVTVLPADDEDGDSDNDGDDSDSDSKDGDGEDRGRRLEGGGR